MTRVDAFEANGTAWAACEDLHQPGGALLLLSGEGEAEWFTQSFAPYGTNASDGAYYLGLNQTDVANASDDLLGAKLLQEPALTWAASSAPPRRSCSCAGTR